MHHWCTVFIASMKSILLLKAWLMVFTYVCTSSMCFGIRWQANSRENQGHTHTHTRTLGEYKNRKKSNPEWRKKPYEICRVARSFSYNEIPHYPAEKKDNYKQQEERIWQRTILSLQIKFPTESRTKLLPCMGWDRQQEARWKNTERKTRQTHNIQWMTSENINQDR